MPEAAPPTRKATTRPTSAISTRRWPGLRFTADFNQFVEFGDAAGGAGFQRAGRDGVDADVLVAEFGGEIAGGRLQGGLDRTHHVVMVHDLVGAVIAHRHQRAALFHQRLGQPRHFDEGIAGHAHRLQRSLPASNR